MTSVLLEIKTWDDFFQIDERTTEGWRLVVQRRLTIGWIQIESIRLVGLEFEARRLVGFRYQKADDWLDSKFHCSYLWFRGVPEKTREIRVKSAGNYLPFISGSGSRLPVHDFRWRHFRWRHNPHNPPQILIELSPYTTTMSKFLGVLSAMKGDMEILHFIHQHQCNNPFII